MSLIDDEAGTSVGYSRSTLYGADVVYLLELDVGGTVYRWSSAPIVVSSDEGDIPFDGGLEDVAYAEELAAVGDASDDRSASFDLEWPGDVSIAALVRRGVDLASCFGELSLLVVGAAYETRVVLISGAVSQPVYGGPDEPFSFTLVEQPFDDVSLVIPANYIIDDNTFPDAPDYSKGKRYPFPFFGANDFDTTPYRARSPAYCIEIDMATGFAKKLMVAGGRVRTADVGIMTYVDNLPVAYGELPVTYTEDDLGQEYGYVDISGLPDTFRIQSAHYVYAWNPSADPNGGGGLVSPFGGAAIQTFGQLMRYLAAKASVRTDTAAFASLCEVLDWPAGGWIDDHVSPLAYLIDQVLPMVPVSLTAGPNGLQPVMHRYDARREDAVERLEAGPGVARVSRVEFVNKPSDLVQRITLSWAYNAATREFDRTTILEPPTNVLATKVFGGGRIPANSRTSSNVYVRVGASRYADNNPDRFRSLNLESVLVQDEITANRVVSWLSAKHCLPIRAVTYEVGVEYGWLELGMVVTVTDDEVALRDTVAIIVRRETSDSGAWSLGLHLLDGLATDRSVAPALPETDIPDWDPLAQ